MCLTLAPGAFRMDEKRQSEFVPDTGATVDDLHEAADGCPMAAIRVIEDSGTPMPAPHSAARDRNAWADGSPEQVAPGVHRIPLPMPNDGLRAVNVYAIEDGDGLVLIDSGQAVPEAEATLTNGLRHVGASLRDIRRIVVTHAHRDHYTLGVVLRRQLGTHISVGAGERASLTALCSPARRFDAQIEMLRRAGAGGLADLMAAGDERVDPLPEGWELPDEWLKSGELELADRALQVVETPGHTQGHLVVVDSAAKLLFAGDHVLPHISPSIGFETVQAVSPLRDYLASLAKVRGLPDARLLPAHGPVTSSVHARVDELVAHHDLRLSQTLSAVGVSEDGSAADVARRMPWTRRDRHFDEFDSFNQMLAVTETIAHLKVLVATASVTHVEGPVDRYEAAVRPTR